MPFTSNCAEDYSKWKIRISGSLDKKDWSATRAWSVYSNDPAFPAATVVPLPGNDPLPQVGTPHPQYPFMIADPQELAGTDNPLYFTLTVNYRYAFNYSLVLSPLLQPPRWRFLVGEETRPVFFDKDGNPIVNSAGDFFDPQPQDTFPTLAIRITRNEGTYDANKSLNFMGSTNSDAWVLPNGQTVQPGQARMHTIEMNQDCDKNALYVPVVYVAFLSPTDFCLQAVDQGYQAWGNPSEDDSLPTVKEKIFNAASQSSGGLSTTTISSPALLDGTGAPIVPANYQIGPNDDYPDFNPDALGYVQRIKTTPGVVGLKFKQLKQQAFNSLALV